MNTTRPSPLNLLVVYDRATPEQKLGTPAGETAAPEETPADE